ncbi:hypothetical protein HDV05_001908 [Chytridiales sp. JEL 0842]|nr:hypothetical protein HDV05_001908 [Chytridiales sp. JEL 0842]
MVLATAATAASVPAPIQARMESGARLIQVAEDKPATWMVESETHFFDLTDELLMGESFDEVPTPLEFPPPTAASQQDVVRPMIDRVSIDSMVSFLTSLSSFPNRYYKSPTGNNSAQWIFERASEIAASSESDINVRQFSHPGYDQVSVIARIEGSVPGAPLVVLGGHQDSINRTSPLNGTAPGADDDGTGSTSLYEAFRILAGAGFKPQRPIEFQWYAGEEVGLLGSQNIAQTYRNTSVPVAGMLQLDMTGYAPEGKTPNMAIITDFTDPALTSFLKTLVETYIEDAPWKDRTCGYACSDHASWFRNGFKSCYAFEGIRGESSPFIHTEKDTIETVNFTHVARFTKLAIAYAIELSMAA